MSDLSATEELNELDSIATGGVYVSLHTADEGDDPDETNEVSAADYARANLAEADITTTKNVGSPSTLENAVEVSFGETTNSWGTVTHFALWSDTSANSGTPYTATVALPSSHDITSGENVYISSGNLTLNLD